MDWDLPSAPRHLRGDRIVLRYSRILPGNLALGLLPAYHFRILIPSGTDVGHINFRVGDEPHETYVAGHIGFGIDREFRGNRLAYRACRALQPWIARVSGTVVITCDPDNLASKRTIELLGARFLNERLVPANDPAYAEGSRSKLRYLWNAAPQDHEARS
jgi:tagatose 1,6-diphosphate aldolase